MQQIFNILHFSRKHKTTLQKRDSIFANTPVFLQNYERYKLNALYFLSLENPIELCRFFETSILKLEEIINHPKYSYHTISKKRGGMRHIFVPEKQLKKIQRRLNYFLQTYYLWIKPEEVHGFVINPRHLNKIRCNIVANAKAHIGKKHILNIDLKDFFSSISSSRIKKLFMSSVFNFSEQMAIALTLLTTYEGKMPTGTPTSPVLSNFICLELDADLQAFCQENNLQFTRYADDLTFSSNERISENVILQIKELICLNGFNINEKKLHLKSSHRKQTVTGLVVNEKVNVDRKRLRNIRAMLHDLTKNGLETATQRHFNLTNLSNEKQRQLFVNRLKGYINFVGQVRGHDDIIYQKMFIEFNKIESQIDKKGFD
jgi:Reverse transcriptase (RNA-dependent DNA polymerase).